MNLDPAVAASGVRLVIHDALGSTNAEALARARAGDRGPLWITARYQTAGRGRRGRSWVSERGNLFASLLLTNPSAAQSAPELSYVAGLALRDAVQEMAPPLRSRLKLKWPNDLLCDGKKLGGILVEGESVRQDLLAVVVGIGLNCAHHPLEVAYPATSLQECGVGDTPDAIFAVLTRTTARRLQQWHGGAQFAAIRSAWLECAIGVGRQVRVTLPERTVEGVFTTLDDFGRLVLRTPAGGEETITAGEMFPIAAQVAASDDARVGKS
jgi:BirA family biotin operon repressor/biotin-[acetyl-CoA-carboxylase] ligase